MNPQPTKKKDINFGKKKYLKEYTLKLLHLQRFVTGYYQNKQTNILNEWE